MPTTNLGLPLITGNMTANVPRDMNVLAEEIDLKVAGKQEIVDVSNDLATHLADVVKHITSAERTNWNGKAPAVHTHTIGQVSELQTTLDSKINKSMINVPNGVVGIGEDGFATVPSQESRIVAGDEYTYAVPKTNGSTLEGVMTPVITFKMFMTGTIRVAFQLYNQSSAAHYSRGSEGQLYINGVPVGILRFVESTKGAVFTEDIPIKYGDTLAFMGRALLNPGYNTQTVISGVTIKRRGDITL